MVWGKRKKENEASYLGVCRLAFLKAYLPVLSLPGSRDFPFGLQQWVLLLYRSIATVTSLVLNLSLLCSSLPSMAFFLEQRSERAASLLFWAQFLLQAVSFICAFTNGGLPHFFLSLCSLSPCPPLPFLLSQCRNLYPVSPLTLVVHLCSWYPWSFFSLDLKLRLFVRYVPIIHGCYMPTLLHLLPVFFKVQKALLCYVLYPKHFLVTIFAMVVYWSFDTGCSII